MKKKWKKDAKILFAVLVPAFIFYLLECYTHNPFADIRQNLRLLNILFFELAALLLYCLIGRLHIALFLETIVCMLYGLVNYFVFTFRSVPIMPWDLLSVGTAAEVAGDFSYTLTVRAGLTLAGFLLLGVLELLFLKNRLQDTVARFYKGPLGSFIFRLPAGILSLLLLMGLVSLLHNETFVEQKLYMYDKLFTPAAMSKRDGTALAFLLELQYIAVERPEEYSKEKAVLFLQEGERNGAGLQTGWELPNIIVIMDEAFSDLSVLGELTTNIPVMPYLDSLRNGAENTVSGMLHVSVKGGNTANTEFEFLTGHTMVFLPYGSVPYQQYIDDEQPSLASYLADLGYETRAVHPYYASGWERETVYPLLGFLETDFSSAFKGAERLRNYVSDAAAFAHIIECYENKPSGTPLFLFEVTMQNHSGYTQAYDNLSEEVAAADCNSSVLNRYLSLLRYTDQAFEELIEYFSAQEEKTLIVFFGDHQPANSVVEPLLRLQGRTAGRLSEAEEVKRYEVPFIIWANYDIAEKSGIETSVNYLGADVLEAAGLPLPAYQSCLEELRKQVPVLTAQYMVTADGYAGAPKGYAKWEAADDEIERLLWEYQVMQYYLLFDQ